MNVLMSGLGDGGDGGDAAPPGSRLLEGLSPKSATLAGLQGATSVLSAMSQMGAGRARASSLRASTVDDALAINQAEVSGQNQIAGLKQRLASAMGGAVQQAGAGGVDVGQGFVQDSVAAMRRNEVAGETLTRGNIALAQSRARMNMLSKMMQANDAEASANSGALGTLLSGGLSIAKLLL